MKWYLYLLKVTISKSKISRENGSYLLQYNYILSRPPTALVAMVTYASP